MYILPTFFVVVLCSSRAFGFAGLFAGGAAVVGAVLAGRPLYCYYHECCLSTRWVHPNLSGLKVDLANKLFGQHIATEVVYKAIKGHVENPNPKKALLLSFHGWTGSGKNHVSDLIAKNLYKKGMDSGYTHLVIATHDFPHKDKVEHYKNILREFITKEVKRCSRSLFIFDEVDKIPPGLMDTLKPFLEHYHEVGGVDYRKSIFIFLSNTGAHLINKEALDHWDKGLKREALTVKQMDEVINKGAFNLEGGLKHSDLILTNLIDYFIPFLPLERQHVKQCIKADLEAKNKPTSEEIIDQVAKELQYFPDNRKVFSKSGCKKIASKVDFVVG